MPCAQASTWVVPMELAMWNCVSCEMWSAYKMKHLGFKEINLLK